MKKRLLGLVCATAMVVSMFAGCGSTGTASESAPAQEASVAEEGTASVDAQAANDVVAERKAKAEKDGEYQKVVVSFFDWTGAPQGLERVNQAISAITEEKLGLDVELLIIDSAAYSEDLKLMLSSGEQVDAFSTCGPGYMTCVNNGYCLDLEEDDLLATYGPDIQKLIREDYMDACRVGGTLYGVPPIKDYAIETAAIIVGKEYLDAVDFDYESLPLSDLGYPRATWEDVDTIFAQIHAAFPDKYVYAIQDNILTQGSCVDAIAGDYYGVLLDGANSLKIENVYTSDMFKEWANRVYAWNQAGYISQDALTDDVGASARVKSGAYMAMMSQAKPGYLNQITGECGREVVVFDVGDSFMSSSAVSAFPWCINQNTDDPVAAMQVLNLLYSDPEIANLACWGEEGVEYKVNADGSINYADGIDANNSAYYPNVLWLMPNQYAARVWEGDPIDIGEQTAAFNDNCPIKSKALGFTWDNSEYASEFTALQNAYSEYGLQVMYGFVEPDQGIADLMSALEAAGLNDYMAAKQAALDAWAAENNIQ